MSDPDCTCGHLRSQHLRTLLAGWTICCAGIDTLDYWCECRWFERLARRASTPVEVVGG